MNDIRLLIHMKLETVSIMPYLAHIVLGARPAAGAGHRGVPLEDTGRRAPGEFS